MSSIHFIPIQQLLNCNMCLTNFIYANFFPCKPVFKAKNQHLEPNHWRYTLNIVNAKKENVYRNTIFLYTCIWSIKIKNLETSTLTK